MKKKTLVSWSSGKDCAWTLYRLQQDPNYEVLGLFSVLSEPVDRIAMHTTRKRLVELQAEAIGLPLYTAYLPEHPCSNQVYESVMEKAVSAFKQAGIECIAFGDLFLEDIRQYRETKMAGTGLEVIFPLWKIPTDQLIREMLDAGLETYISSVDLKALPASLAGQRITRELIETLPSGIDPCGENGETHTIVVDGPMFQSRITVSIGAMTEANGYAYADIIPGELIPKSALCSHWNCRLP